MTKYVTIELTNVVSSYLSSYLTSRSKVFCEKITDPQVVKKITHFLPNPKLATLCYKSEPYVPVLNRINSILDVSYLL